MNFFWRKNYSHINCDFLFITFLNDLPHTMHVTSYGVSSLFSNVFNILHMNCLLEFRKITFTIHFFFTFLTGIIFRPLLDEITIHGNVKITFHYDSAHAPPLGVYLISFSRVSVGVCKAILC